MPIAPTTGTLPLGSAQIHQQLADAVSMDASLKGIIYSRLLETYSGQHNAFEAFTSDVNPKSNLAGGVRTIFARKKDLAAGGGQEVKFNVLGPPGGPGAKGAQSLVDRTSSVQMATYAATVAFHRDAVSFSKDLFEFLSAGRVLESTAIELLSKKMGINKQNHMAMRLIRSATSGNTYRPNNRTSTATLTPDDGLSLSTALSARARLSVLGGKPLSMKVGPNGSPVRGYMTFATDMAFLPLRNDDSFLDVINNTSNSEAAAALTNGTLFNWQGMGWFEQPSVDEKWDDYIGSPFLPKAKIGLAVSRSQAVMTGSTLLSGTGANTLAGYFQFFPNSPYNWDGGSGGGAGTDGVCPDSAEHYAWVVTPAGKYGFVAYTNGFTAGSNQLTLTKILSGNGTDINETTVGDLAVGSGASGGDGDIVLGTTGRTVPTGVTYTDQFPAQSIVIPANASGVPIGYGFVFGAMAACFANGRIDKAMIEQEEDFGFIKKRGYEMIFGTCVTKDPFAAPAGYLLLEHAVEHEGYPVPEKITAVS